jgi:transposase InsO family protein
MIAHVLPSVQRPASAIRAENLVVRKQLAAYIERGTKLRRLDHVGPVSLSVLSRVFSRRETIVIVRPSTVIRWRRLAHVNVTAHLGAEWTLQQLREALGESRQRNLIHDRDPIYSRQLDESIEAIGLEMLRSPIASPKANAICERVIGTIRRECLDWMIPLSEAHLQAILAESVTHYNRGRPHSALGPGRARSTTADNRVAKVQIPSSAGGG